MHTANQIADWFLAWADDIEADLSNLKLQKLLYYAQGHYLASTGTPLFEDRVEAWAHGPVVRGIYARFKKYGKSVIDADSEIPDSFDWDDYIDVNDHLVKIWNTYGGYEAWTLRNRTHSESPWRSVWNSEVDRIEIPQASMRSYFASVL